MQFREIDIVKAPECTRSKLAIILCHGRPNTVPTGFLCELQGEGEMFDVPSTLRCLRPLVRGILQFDQASMSDGQLNVNLTTWRLEERCEHRVHLEFLRDTTMDGIIAIDTNLVCSIIREVEGDSWVIGRLADADKDFANDLTGIDADRVEAKGTWLFP
jgi:hypothetical protein